MPTSAFILPSAPILPGPRLRASTFTASRALRSRPAPTRRLRAPPRANADTEEKPPATDTADTAPPASDGPPVFEPPSFDTDVFSKWVDSAQAKVDDLQDSLQNLDTDELLADGKEASAALVDNILAGDWLNRGELYGAIQLVFVVLLLRSPGFLDGLVSFICGPIILLAGAFVSGKSLLDLGRKQLSIWPAPVPDAELKTEGLYQYVRHPMYSGLILASAGWAVSTGSPARLALTIAFAAFLTKKIDVEEEFLVDSYPDYKSYCDKVKSKILPGIF